MSFLYPLFLAGIAGVALPIILHMIRRQTRKRVTFSSLMFLRTTVPRFKNRSRLENLPLLILRCIILCLLAFAFSRPFFPRDIEANKVSAAKRTVLLIDTSASMRRAGLWPHVVSEAQSVLKGAGPNDRVCIMRFDQNAETLIGFEQWNWDPILQKNGKMGTHSMESGRRTAIANEEIAQLSPSWASTNLGQALVSAAEAIGEDEVNDEQSTGWPSSQKSRIHQIVLISDLQKGCDLEALQAYEWPDSLKLDVKLIASADSTNASMQLIEGPHFAKRLRNGNPDNRDHPVGTAGNELPSVRITNSPDAAVERFGLSWADEDQPQAPDSTGGLYVPAGHSVVVHVPQRSDNSSAGKLVLTGDSQDFDNALYVSPRLMLRVNILFIGIDSEDDSEGMLYYVRRAFRTTGTIEPAIIFRTPQNLTDADIEAAHLIIATDEIRPEHIGSVRKYLETGRTVLLVLKSPDTAKTIAALTGTGNIQSQEADADTYAMLNRIEFKHPLLAPFSEPRYGDFTKIHFWKHRRINIEELPGAEVLAWFDSPQDGQTHDDPALFELHVAKEPALRNSKGSLLVLTSGWNPADSQLALSSKFVPLLYSILEYSGIFANRQSQYFVGDHVPVSPLAGSGSTGLEIRKPDNSTVRLNPGQESFAQTDMPGIYTIEWDSGSQTPSQNQVFALNLPARESQTDVMPIEDLEELGVSLTRSSVFSAEHADLTAGARNLLAGRHSSTLALESEQKIWRWILIGLLAVSFIEITLAGWLTRSPSKLQGEQK
jgi:hypothetical protein